MKGIIRSTATRLVLLVTLMVVVLTVAAGASAATSVTIGQTFTSGVTCSSSGFFDVQASSVAGAAVPAGDWTITSWSTGAFGAGNSLGLMVYRPTATPGSYTVVGESQVQPLAAGSGVQTFNLVAGTADPPIPVEPGDLIGFWHPPSSANFQACVTDSGDPGNVTRAGVSNTQPAVGAVVTTVVAGPGFLENLSATLTPTVGMQLAALLQSVTGVGPGKSLANKVMLIQSYVDADNTAAACDTLTGFINEVNAQTGKKITAAQAASFISQAQAIQDTLGC
jgi:hypothetical protein